MVSDSKDSNVPVLNLSNATLAVQVPADKRENQECARVELPWLHMTTAKTIYVSKLFLAFLTLRFFFPERGIRTPFTLDAE
jgi:hypothetical protein